MKKVFSHMGLWFMRVNEMPGPESNDIEHVFARLIRAAYTDNAMFDQSTIYRLSYVRQPGGRYEVVPIVKDPFS